MIDLVKTQQQFIKNLEMSGKSFNTIKNYRADLQVFNRFLASHKRSMTLKTFTVTQVQEYAGFLEKTYGSPNSIRRRVQALRLFFDFLVREHKFPDNPIKLVPVAAKLLEKPTPPSFKDLIRLKDSLRNRINKLEGLERLMNLRNLLVVAMIYETGIKVSDLARLEMSDILPDKHGLRLLVRPLKREPYSIPLSSNFKTLWNEYMSEFKIHWPGPGEIRYVLFNANPHRILSGSLSPRGTELFFEEVRKILKIEVTARTVRQACVFKWMAAQIGESQIKEWLGVAPDYDLSLYNQAFNATKETPVYLDLNYA
ncbi:MAG: site-specific integrase [Bacteriovoracaceae bacterium]|nr:site-specific integrase [Bacteriovoracaceae bacterium]